MGIEGGEMRGFYVDDCRRRYANVLPNRSGGKGSVWKMFEDGSSRLM